MSFQPFYDDDFSAWLNPVVGVDGDFQTLPAESSWSNNLSLGGTTTSDNHVTSQTLASDW
jgi:hypothetical protein